MLSEIFYWVLNVSIVGSLMGLGLLALRRIKYLPRFVVYLLWLIPLFRLWSPFGLANRYSFLNLLSKFTTRTVVVWERAPGLTTSNFLMAADEYFPITYKTQLLEGVFTTASFVWIVVAAAGVLTAVLLYALTKSALKSAEHVRDNIYQSPQISSPAVYGIFRPKIILPTALAKGDSEYILMHERVHIARRDNLWRVAAVITACLHWFNPLVWIFLKCFFADMELACDAKVIRQLTAGQKKEYAVAVLTAAQGKAFFASAFGGAKTRVRIESILSYKKLTAFSAVCFAALFIAVAVVLLTNAAG